MLNSLRLVPVIEKTSFNSEENIVGFIAKGKLVEEDYTQVVVPELNHAIAKYGKIRALLKIEDFEGWTRAAALEDIKLISKIEYFDRMAIVGKENLDKELLDMFKFLASFTDAQIRFYSEQKLADALDWLKEK